MYKRDTIAVDLPKRILIVPAVIVIILSGGKIVPGSSIGTLSTGPVTSASSSTLSMELGTTADTS